MADEAPENNSHFENKVILVAILTGFIGSIIIYFMKLPPVVVAIFLATGVAALVYRFLGGAAGASMAMGTLKLSGSIAVLLGSAWFINGELIKQSKDGIDRPDRKLARISFVPHRSNWIAVDKRNGEPVEVKIAETEEVIEKPDKNIFKNVPLRLQLQNNRYVVTPEEDSLFILGQINDAYIKSANLFNGFQKTEDFVVTERLLLGESDLLSPFPFKIQTTTYSNEYSHFQLIDKSTNKAVYEGRIYRRRFEVIELMNKHYFIAVVEVNHQPKDPENPMSKDPYAKFAIAEIEATFK